VRKKSWGRLGAAISAVALLAGGLVGVAAPSNAEEDLILCGKRNVVWNYPPPPDEIGQSLCDTKGLYLGHEVVFKKWGDVIKNEKPGQNDTYEAYGVKAPQCSDTEVPDGDGGCREKTPEEKCEGKGTWDEDLDVCWEEDLVLTDGVVGDNGVSYSSYQLAQDGVDPPAGYELFTIGDVAYWGIPVTEPEQEFTPPPPCWDASINNCPVGGALRFVAPKYAMVGVPVTMYAYASWRPDANAPSQPTNGTAVIRVDGEDYSGVEFKDGIAEWRFIPETEGMKEFTASGVLFSGLSGANAYIDTVPARTYVLEYDPAAYAAALKKKAVEVGDTYVITDPNQARSYLEDRYEWSVSDKSDDVCAVYETKKGAVKAKFNGEGKCTVIWLDKESGEEGKYSFIAKK